MSPEIQSIVALAVVAVVAIWLLWSSLRRKSSGCGGSCGAVSRDAKKFRAKIGL